MHKLLFHFFSFILIYVKHEDDPDVIRYERTILGLGLELDQCATNIMIMRHYNESNFITSIY